ncbi:MAG: hypothetical protein LBB78_09850 [Spirochaetaceae bacterium]|jgi:hypothetical protein|nr:hypothetical protein [Spirochaetaceae bacterium]
MLEYLPLNELFKKYRSGFLDKKQLEGQIFQYVLNNHKQFHLYQWKRDDCIDYLCWLYPRISKAIDKYKDIGTSFDAYIGALVYYSSREYHFRETEHSISEHSWWKEKANELSVRNTEPDYPEQKTAYKPVSNPQQILILLLKSYHFVSDDFISRVAPAIKIETDKLKDMMNELRVLRTDKEEQIHGLKERIHCQFYRCISFERRMLAAPDGSMFQKKISDRLNRARIRLESMRKRLSIMRLDATNRQIAKVLGIPKGTVDSTLYAVKIKYKPKDKEC